MWKCSVLTADQLSCDLEVDNAWVYIPSYSPKNLETVYTPMIGSHTFNIMVYTHFVGSPKLKVLPFTLVLCLIFKIITQYIKINRIKCQCNSYNHNT